MAIITVERYQVTDTVEPFTQATLFFSYDDTDNDVQELWCDNQTTQTARYTVARINGTGPAPRSIDFPPGDTTRYAVGQGVQTRYRINIGSGGKISGLEDTFTLIG